MTENQTETTKRYHHGDLRNALIAAGRDILSEEGIAGLDLRKVARRAGVSHAAPYRHFSDKQALLAAIAEEGFTELISRMQTAIEAASDDFMEQLKNVADVYVAFGTENPAWMREMFSGLTIDRMEYPSLYATSKAALKLIIDIIERGQQAEKFAKGDAHELAIVFWSLMHGLTMLLLENQIPGTKDNKPATQHLINSVINTLYGGLKN